MFLTIEGLDGSGKTTQLNMLEKAFKEEKKQVRTYHFPNHNDMCTGFIINKYLRGDFGKLEDTDPYLTSFIFAVERSMSAGKMYSCLNVNMLIMADRYVESNIAYQAAKIKDIQERGIFSAWDRKMEYTYFKIPKPDLNLFLDVPIEDIKANIEKRDEEENRKYLDGGIDIHERNYDYLQSVRDIYLDNCEKGFMRRLDCSDETGHMGSPEYIFQKIKTLLDTEYFTIFTILKKKDRTDWVPTKTRNDTL